MRAPTPGGSRPWTSASARSTRSTGAPVASAMSLERDGQIAGLVEHFGDDPREIADRRPNRRGAGPSDARRAKPAAYSSAVEVERFVARRRPTDVGEAVGFQRFRRPVHVERPVVVGLAEDEVVGAGIVGRFVSLANPRRRRIAGGLALVVAGARFEQRVLRQLLGDKRLELEVAAAAAA